MYYNPASDLVIELNDTKIGNFLKEKEIVVQGIKIKPVTMDGLTTVRVKGVSKHVTDKEIEILLSKYGNVKHIKAETYAFAPNIKTGQIMVRMTINTPIPTKLKCKQEEILIQYAQQQEYCNSCNS